jgi:DNA-damage-inducible protein J
VFVVAETVNVTIRLDREIKERAETLFSDLGMNLSTAFNIFARQSLRQGKIPFEIYDPFYGEKNQAELRRRIEEVESGKAKLTVHELIETDDD